MVTKSANDTAVDAVSGSSNGYYDPPLIEVTEIFLEKGFADSTTDWGDDSW
ncbi:MAG: hypothetical protein WC833_02875 [Bacteroidales bacterium]|jgi:hypothetical protein